MESIANIRNSVSSLLAAQKKNRLASALLLAAAGLLYGFGSYPFIISLVLYAAALIFLFRDCMNLFTDKYDIPPANEPSVPLTDAEEYFSRLLAMAYIWLLPIVISVLCSFILSKFTALAASVNGGGSSAAGASVFGLKLLAGYIETALYILAATVIYQCCTASKRESFYMPLLLIMALLTAAPLMLSAAVSAVCFNHSDLLDNALDLLTNPMPFLLLDDYSSAEYFIVFAVRSLIYLAAAGCGVFIYKKRSDPMVFTVFLEIVVWLSLLLCFSVCHASSSFSLTAMFYIWLGSIILWAVASKEKLSPKMIFRRTGMYLVHYAVFLLFMFIAFKTNGFNGVGNIPDISELEDNGIMEITVWISIPNGGPTRYDIEYSTTAAADDKEDIRAFMELTVNKSKMQSSLNKIYFREMFDNKMFAEEISSESCEVTVFFGSHNWRADHQGHQKYCLYDISFYMPLSEKENFIREFEEFDGFENYTSD